MRWTRPGARLAYLAAIGMTLGCFERYKPAWDDAASMADTLLPDTGRAAAVADLEPGALATVQAAPVEQWEGPGGRPFEVAGRTSEGEAGHSRRFGNITLQTSLRARTVGQYPCTSCHLGRKVVMADQRIAQAHENIQPVHPKETGAVCSTCHAADNVAELPLRQGGRASLEQSYRLCAQCHFQQVEAWAAGAHGKRLDGWEGRRVVMGCGDCHDPHQPAIEPRVPFRAPHLERAGVTNDEH
jgi:hypothetical protein